MKRFTLLLAVVMMSIVGLAQKPVVKTAPVVRTQTAAPRFAVKGIHKDAKTRTIRAQRKSELVEPPVGGEAETWYTTSGSFYVYDNKNGWVAATSAMKQIQVIIADADIYVQGLAYFFEDAWIKGTIEEGNAIFPSGQLLGEDGYGSEYLIGSEDGQTVSDNIIFAYDSEAGTLTATTPLIAESSSATEVLAYGYWESPAFSKTEPETPDLVELPDGVESNTWYTTGGKFYCNTNSGFKDYTSQMSTVNVAIDGSDIYIQGLAYWFEDAWIKGTIEDGNAIFPSGQFVGEDDYGQEFLVGSDDGKTATETIVFAYDSEAGTLTATTSEIIESASATEVVKYTYWDAPVFSMTAPEPEGFDFNAMTIATSSDESHAGDITEDLTLNDDNGTTLVISPAIDETKTPNRFWGTTDGPQLRMYSGTMTFTAPEGRKIMKIEFDYGKWNANNEFAAEGDEEVNGAYANGVWSTEVGATKVTVTIGGNTQLNKVTVTLDGEETNELITPPDGIDPITLYLGSVEYYGDYDAPIQVVIDGTDVYVQGVGGPIELEDAWIKGTLDPVAKTVTFPAGQYMGDYESLWSGESDPIYFTGFNMDEGTVCDVVIDLDINTLTGKMQAYGTLVAVLCTDVTDPENTMMDYYRYIELTPTALPDLVEITPPEDLKTDEYIFTAFDWAQYEEEEDGPEARPTTMLKAKTKDGKKVFSFKKVRKADGDEGESTEEEDPTAYKTHVFVGFDGTDVYIQGISDYMPSAWSKGTFNAEDNTITIPANQYLGAESGFFSDDSYFLTSSDEEGMEFVDIVLDYNAEAGEITSKNDLIINSSRHIIYYWNWLDDVLMKKMTDFAVTPQAPVITDVYVSTQEGYSELDFTLPTTDAEGNELQKGKLFYQIWVVGEDGIEQPLTLTPGEYKKLTEELSEISSVFTDNYDISFEGEDYMVYLCQALETIGGWTKIGVQAIYYGGGECNKSEITWWVLNKNKEPEGFDFNAMEGIATSSNDSDAGDITDELTLNNDEGVTLVISPAVEEATTPNRFWGTNNGPQLRMYSGTMTFTAPEGRKIVKIEFDNNKWNEGNTITDENGNPIGEYADGVWSLTDGAETVVVNISGNTQLNKVVVTLDEAATGISTLSAESSKLDTNAPMYNIAGQRVAKGYKGVVIQNGKKFIVK
ncbi:MAG: hypothetical protein J6Z41_09415 [Prevotella sp.]|nr:hypothetical protein [Prevotella sp.]